MRACVVTARGRCTANRARRGTDMYMMRRDARIGRVCNLVAMPVGITRAMRVTVA